MAPSLRQEPDLSRGGQGRLVLTRRRAATHQSRADRVARRVGRDGPGSHREIVPRVRLNSTASKLLTSLLNPPFRALLNNRPNLIQRIPIIKNTVFHDVSYLPAVMDVVQRVLIQNNEVRDLPNFKRPKILLNSKGFSSHDSSSLQRLHIA